MSKKKKRTELDESNVPIHSRQTLPDQSLKALQYILIYLKDKISFTWDKMIRLTGFLVLIIILLVQRQKCLPLPVLPIRTESVLLVDKFLNPIDSKVPGIEQECTYNESVLKLWNIALGKTISRLNELAVKNRMQMTGSDRSFVTLASIVPKAVFLSAPEFPAKIPNVETQVLDKLDQAPVKRVHGNRFGIFVSKMSIVVRLGGQISKVNDLLNIGLGSESKYPRSSTLSICLTNALSSPKRQDYSSASNIGLASFDVVRQEEIIFNPMISGGLRISGAINPGTMLTNMNYNYQLVQKGEIFVEFRVPLSNRLNALDAAKTFQMNPLVVNEPLFSLRTPGISFFHRIGFEFPVVVYSDSQGLLESIVTEQDLNEVIAGAQYLPFVLKVVKKFGVTFANALNILRHMQARSTLLRNSEDTSIIEVYYDHLVPILKWPKSFVKPPFQKIPK